MAHEQTSEKVKPFWGGWLLSETILRDATGRTSCNKIFTALESWDFPSAHEWSVTFTAYNLPEGKITFQISIRKKGANKKDLLKEDTQTIVDDRGIGITAVSTLRYQFNSSGTYIIEIKVKEINMRVSIPFVVSKREWPVFTKAELAKLRKSQSIPKAFKVVLRCKCGQEYIFEDSPLKSYTRAQGTLPFPDDGEYLCPRCGNTLNLRDLQGRLLAAMKKSIKKAS